MKKIVKLILVLCMTIFIMGNVYAALSCEVSVQASKIEVSKNEEFTVDFNLSNIQSERGIISLGATLEYNKDSLELVKMEGKNGWETPVEGVSYNPSKGKIAITRSGLGKKDETVFTATFKVKENSKQNLLITLKNITVADGTLPAKIKLTYQNIIVKDGESNPVPTPGTDDDTNTSNNNTNSNLVENKVNNNKNTNKSTTITNTVTNNSTNKANLPKAGETMTRIFMILIAFAVLIAVIFFIKFKTIDKKIG